MSTTSERDSDPAGQGTDAGDRTVELAEGDGQAVRTGTVSGGRSSTGGSVDAATCPPGPTLAALRKLAVDLENDDEVVDRFVADYLSLLEHRLGVLGALLSAGGPPEAVRLSILSLETTSAMIGAGDVVAAARSLRFVVAQKNHPDTSESFRRLRAAGEALGVALADPEFRTRQQPRPVAG